MGFCEEGPAVNGQAVLVIESGARVTGRRVAEWMEQRSSF